MFSTLYRTYGAPSGDRLQVGAKFSAPVQTGPRAHPASYTMGPWSFSGVKQPGRGIDHPSTSSAEVKERVELHLHLPLWAFMTCSRVNFTLSFNLYHTVHQVQHLIFQTVVHSLYFFLTPKRIGSSTNIWVKKYSALREIWWINMLYYMLSVAQNSETCLHGSKCLVERRFRSITDRRVSRSSEI
jgi:hypothetical protein